VSIPAETISVPDAGVRLGISRSAAYAAAHRGEIPTLRLGNRLVVPLAAFKRLLRGELAQPTTGKRNVAAP